MSAKSSQCLFGNASVFLRRHFGNFNVCLAILIAVVCVLPAMLVSPLRANAATAPIQITTTSLPNGEVNARYSQQLGVSGGTSPYVWSAAQALPAGLTLTTKGLLSGTPTAPFTGVLSFSVVDTAAATLSISLSIELDPGPVLTPIAAQSFVAGTTVSTQFTATGGALPYNWQVASGALPPGLVLQSNGILTGLPGTVGTTTAAIALTDAAGARLTANFLATVTAPSIVEHFLTVDGSGGVSAFSTPGGAVPQTGQATASNIVGIAENAVGTQYWMTTASGIVYTSPRTRSFGSVAKKKLSGSIVGIATKANGSGYWLTSSSGEVYGFGSARPLGSVAKGKLSGRIVGIAARANGTGYWLVSSTGKVYGFGSSHILRSHAKVALTNGVVGIASDPNRNGYWIVANDGRVAAFGAAPTHGSLAPRLHVHTIVGIAPTPNGDGYWVVSRAGVAYQIGKALSLNAVAVAAGANTTGIASPE